MIRLGDLFEIEYGTNLALNKLSQINICVGDAVNFVSRTSKNNGVSAIVKKKSDINCLEAGLITVSVGGSVLETFIQPMNFYTGYHIMVLKPKIKMSYSVKFFYVMCIRNNKYKYSYGRQANKTLKDILVPSPSDIPSWVYSSSVPDYSHIPLSFLKEETPELKVDDWKEFRLDEIFEIEIGKGPSSKYANENIGETPFISATANNNGVTTFTSYKPTHKANTITVSRNGSIGESFYQNKPFCATADVGVLNAKFKNNQYISLFISTILIQEKYKYNYGRKWNSKRMNETIIKIPADKDGNPDWEYMENYIKTLKFSKEL